MSKELSAAKSTLRKQTDRQKAEFLQRYFKTGRGEYAEGDRFLGVTVPQVRAVSRRFRQLPLADLNRLIRSSWHEERLLALLILVLQYQKGDVGMREKVFRFYLSHLKWINNWDLVDCSARYIVGPHLHDGDPAVLRKLVRSPVIWERRVALLATFHFITQGDFEETFHLARVLIRDDHDLIHKATGWMLREVGKRSPSSLKSFLDEHACRLPRTALRYAIERMPEGQRKAYLATKTTRDK